MTESRISLLMDGSGSMIPNIPVTVDAINEYLNTVRALKETIIKIVVWDDARRDIIYLGEAIDAPVITRDKYICNGMTPLLDVFGEELVLMNGMHKDIKKVVVLMTDGLENASFRYTTKQLLDLVRTFENKGGKVIFLGANLDDFTTKSLSTSLGVSVENATSYDVSESRSVYYAKSVETMSFLDNNKEVGDQ